MIKRILLAFLACFIVSADIAPSFAVTVTAKSRTFTNGTANDATQVDASFTETYNNDQTLATAVTNIENGQIVTGKELLVRYGFAGTPAGSDNILFSAYRGSSSKQSIRWNETGGYWDITQNGGSNFAPLGYVGSSDPSGPADGWVWYNTTSHLLKLYTNGSTQSLNAAQYPTHYHGSARPVFASTSTITMANIAERDSTDAVNITKTTSTTFNTATAGAINGINQSAAQAGTCSTSGSSTTVTFAGLNPSTVYQAGDILAPSTGSARRITATSSTTVTLESATTINASSTCYRGAIAPNAWYYFYAATNGTTVGLLASTRNVAGGDTMVDLPSGYTYYDQLKFAFHTEAASTLIQPFTVSGATNSPFIHYDVVSTRTTNGTSWTAGTANVLNAGTSGSFAAVSLASFVPAISKFARLYAVTASNTNFGYWSLRATGDGTNGKQFMLPPDSSGWMELPTDSSQSVDYQKDTGSGSLYLDVDGWYPTEVP